MKRRIQKEETRGRLVEAAYKVICEKGFMNTRISDIAEAASVSHGTVFVHFESLEALITEVTEEYGQKIAMGTHELAASSASMEELLCAHLDGIAEYEPFYTRLVIENRLLPQAVRDAWIGVQAASSFHFSRVVEAEWPELNLNTALLFNAWIGLVHHYLVNGDLFAPEGRVIPRYKEALVGFYLKMAAGCAKEDKADE